MNPLYRFRGFALLTLILAIITPLWFSALRAAEKPQDDGPTVDVLSPKESGYVMLPAGEGKTLICIEITDVSGAGIQSDDAGIPRFLGADENVELFRDYIVEKGTYINFKGQSVLQLVSLMPTSKMKTGSVRLTPPIDFKKIPPVSGERQFTLTAKDSVEAAKFQFQVQDLRGIRSNPASGQVTIGFASGLWTPPE
ncbi:MAG TPA: hypothetical protein VFT43_00025 [Candidatus Polarisedimenticolia bacterium]|nr:hypothetical protein [Candidatus Polarisedimenticolia bacterium]